MAEETKQTAVEWLYLKLSTSSSEEMVGNINVWFEQAKEMEKEQMVDFAYKCRNVMAADEFAITHWYDKTFNTKEK